MRSRWGTILLAASVAITAGAIGCGGPSASALGRVAVCGTTLFESGDNSPSRPSFELVPVSGSLAASGPRHSVIPPSGSWLNYDGPGMFVVYTELLGCDRIPVVTVQSEPPGAAHTLAVARGGHDGIAGMVLSVPGDQGATVRIRAYLRGRLVGQQTLTHQLASAPQIGRYWSWCFFKWQPGLGHHPALRVC